MNPDKLNAFRCVFVQRLKELESKANRMASIMRESERSHPDPIDRASAETDIHLELLIKEQEREMIREIRDAITRIDQGFFGLCTVCGGIISERRLLARPTSRLCVQCQELNERGLVFKDGVTPRELSLLSFQRAGTHSTLKGRRMRT